MSDKNRELIRKCCHTPREYITLYFYSQNKNVKNSGWAGYSQCYNTHTKKHELKVFRLGITTYHDRQESVYSLTEIRGEGIAEESYSISYFFILSRNVEGFIPSALAAIERLPSAWRIACRIRLISRHAVICSNVILPSMKQRLQALSR